MEILNKLWQLLQSPRFISLYWTAGISAVVGFLTLITEVIPDLGVSEFTAVLIVGLLSQLTKALDNYKKGKPLGFAPKQ
jgi:uncharacterized membrane protein YdcZ (DUF606 family)